MLDYKEIKDAYARIKDYIYETPLEKSIYLSTDERNYYLKLESLQTVKSFKIRGTLNKLLTLSKAEAERGVGTISSGSHGVSVSYGTNLLGMKRAKIIVPETTPQSKLDRMKYYGADVMLLGSNYDECHSKGMKFIDENGLVYIDPYYDDVKVYAGQGTIGIEILKQNPDIDTIVVPIGGGGLITGIAVAAKAIKPDIKIVGVQTAACPAMIKSYEDKVFYEEYPNDPSVCDALVGGVGKLSYDILKDYCDELIQVTEESIRKATAFIIKNEKFIVEPSSAVCAAAVMNFGKEIGGKDIALIMSGGNIDVNLMVELLNQY